MNTENIKTEIITVPLASIIVPEDRVRSVDPVWAKGLAHLMRAHGNKTPMDVRPGEKEKEYILVAGGHRHAGHVINGEENVRVTLVHIDSEKAAAEYRIYEAMENIERRELNVLDRAHSLFELKKAYEAAYPETKHGGDKGNQHTGGKERQNEIFSFSQDTALKLGVSSRSIELAVKLWKDLSVATRQAVDGTWLADHQAGLMTLAGQSPKMQAKILEVVFDPENQVKSVADALVFIEQGRLATAREKQISSYSSTFASLEKMEPETVDQIVGLRADFLIASLKRLGKI